MIANHRRWLLHNKFITKMSDNNTDLPKKSFLGHLVDYVGKNPFLTLWNMVAIIGGMVGYIHYLRVGYIPEIDIKSAGTIFIALALTGILLTVALTICFIFPSIYLRMLFFSKTAADTAKEQSADPDIFKYRKIIAWKMLRASIFALGVWGLIFWAADADRLSSPNFWNGLAGGFLILIAVVISLPKSRKHETDSHEPENKSSTWWHRRSDFLWTTSIWIISFFLVFLLLIYPVFENKDLSLTGKILSTIEFLIAVVFANIGLAIVDFKKNTPINLFVATGIAFVPMILFLGIPHTKFSLETAIFSQLGLGRLQHTFFLVKPDACEALNLIRKNTCISVNHDDEKKTKSSGCIRPDFLESRIGKEFLLAYENPETARPEKEEKKNETYISLKKEDVLTWSFSSLVQTGNAQCAVVPG